MPTAATIASSAAIVKELYPDGEVPWEVYRKYNYSNWVEKDTEFVGNPARVPIQSDMTMGASASFAVAQANVVPSTYGAFAVTRVTDFSIARIDNHALAAADGGEGSFVRLWEREIDSAMMHAQWALEIQLFRGGTGSRGQIGTVSTTLITLTNPTDIVGFGVGMTLDASAADGGALRTVAGVPVVSGIDRAAGTLTCATNWGTAITSIAANDFLYRGGDGANGGAHVVIEGLSSWLVGGTTPGTLFGFNRTVDPVRYAGQVFNSTGVSLEEAVIEAYARAGVEGGMPDAIFMHPRKKAALLKSLESKTMYSKSGSMPGTVGFGNVKLETDDGEVAIYTSPFCPFNQAFMLQKDTIELGSIGKVPAIQDFDDNQYLRVSNADQLEVRIYSYYQQFVKAPGWNVQLTNFGN